MPEKRSGLCVIRKYKEEDREVVKEIISEATMATVGEFFNNAVFSEIFIQVAVITFFIAFVVFHIPFTFCFLTLPFAVILIYVIIWAAHYTKAMELHEDLNVITKTYLASVDTCFWVAEVYDIDEVTPLAAEMHKMKKVEYDFFTEEEFRSREVNVRGLKKFVVGTTAVTKSAKHSDRAWLRRMAVKSLYQRRKIASHLLEAAVNFCSQHPYKGIELVTTDCHYKARELYLRKGFKPQERYCRSYFNVQQPVHRLYLPLNRPEVESVVVSE